MNMRRRPLPPVREESPEKTWASYCDNDWVMYSSVAVIGALCYVNSLDGAFVHDDIPAIVTNADVIGRNSIYQVFLNDFWGTPMVDPASHKSYRPLTILTFRINHAVWGLNPRWWHVSNVVLHALCCALVARVGVSLARLPRPDAALAAALFAVHPVHTEAVSGVVGRADVLACALFLASILVYHGSGRHRVLRSVVLAACSMLAKETGVTALLVIVGLDLYKRWAHSKSSSSTRRSRYRRWPTKTATMAVWFVVLAAGRLLILQGSMPTFSPQDNPAAFHPSVIVRLMTFSYLAAFNCWLLLCPWSLSHDWQMDSIPLVTSWLDARNFVTCAAIAMLLAIVYTCYVDLDAQRHTPLVVGLLVMVLPFVPASNVFFTVGFVVAERVLYMPSVGWCLVAAHCAARWRRRGGGGRVAAAALLVLLLAGAARCLHRNQAWTCREALLRTDLKVLPHNAKLQYNMGNFYKDIDQKDNAIKHYKEAVRLWPWYASAHNNLGAVVSAGAEEHYLRAIASDPTHGNARYNLAKIYRKKNRLAESLGFIQRCIDLHPYFQPAYLLLAELKPLEERGAVYRKLISLDPRKAQYWIAYGTWMVECGWPDAALGPYLRALRVSLEGEWALSALRHAAATLRRRGHRARMLQLIVRWQHSAAAHGEAEARAQRRRRLAAWRLREDIERKARFYSLPQRQIKTSTCLDHSKLEVPTAAENILKNHKTDCKEKNLQSKETKVIRKAEYRYNERQGIIQY